MSAPVTPAATTQTSVNSGTAANSTAWQQVVDQMIVQGGIAVFGNLGFNAINSIQSEESDLSNS
ncbi:MAG TPA: hypothetical protein VF286_02635 [Acidiphilium sp.]